MDEVRALGEGTTVTITLPVAEGDAGQRGLLPRVEPPLEDGSVDDERAGQLALPGRRAIMVGHRNSRPTRHRVLRTARVTMGAESAEVRVRDLSIGGMMIDNVDLPEEAIGHSMEVNLGDGEVITATVRWTKEGRAGLQFSRQIDIERLIQPPQRQRRTGSRG